MQKEQEKNNAQGEDDILNSVTDVTVEGSTATVKFNNDRECSIVVAVFDEEGKKLLASGIKSITKKNAEEAQVTIVTDEMPPYFIVRTYLLDKNNRPLCKSFESNHYTKKFQEFISKTTEDFKGEEVYNLDESDSNNFAVFDSSAVKINMGEKNKLKAYDESTNTYTFENIDDKLSSLKQGDVFYCKNADDYLIIKVKSITINGTTAIITKDEDIELKDAFDYVKIDTTDRCGEAKIDMSKADEGITFDGIKSSDEEETNDTPAPSGRNRDINASGKETEKLTGNKWSFSISRDFKSADDSDKKIKVEGKVTYQEETWIKMYLDSTDIEVTYQFLDNLEASIGFSGELPLRKCELADVEIPTGIACLTLEMSLSFVLKAEGSISFNATRTSRTGFIAKTWGDKVKNLSKPADLKFTMEAEFKIFLGFELEVGIKAFEVVKLGVDMSFGLELSASNNLIETSNAEQHCCGYCLKGEVKLKFEVTFKLKADVRYFELGPEIKLIDSDDNDPLAEFYYSNELGFGEGSCPNYKYKTKLYVVDPNGEALYSATVNEKKVDGRGTIEMFLQNGENKVKTSAYGYKDEVFTLDITEPGFAVLMLYPEGTPKPIYPYDESKGTPTCTGQCGDDVYYALYPSGELAIGGKGAMYDYEWKYKVAPWHSFKEQIKSLTILPGVTRVGNFSFYESKNLNSVDMSGTVKAIGRDAFDGCDGLTSIKLPEGVVELEDYAFSSCEKLRKVTLPDSLTTVAHCAFAWCPSLSSINMPDSITNLGEGVFVYCKRLKEINIPRYIRDIPSGLYSDCTGLTEVTIPPTVWNIGNSAFSGCSNITQINFAGAIGSIGEYAFSGCSKLTSITIPENVTEISNYMFSGCKRLAKVKLSYQTTSIGEEAFYDCRSLKEIIIPSTVTSIGNSAFGYCESLNKVDIVDISKWCEIDFGDGSANPLDCANNLYVRGNKVTEVTFPEGTRAIKNWVFCGLKDLCSVTIPDSVTEIGDGAFAECTNLLSVNIPEKVTAICGSTFYNCSSLLSVKISGEITYIGISAFQGCTNLTRITLPESLTEIGYYAFMDCSSLKSIVIPDGVAELGQGIFINCTSLSEVTISTGLKTVYYEAFAYCDKIKDVYFKGSEEQWNTSSETYYSPELKNADIHFIPEDIVPSGDRQRTILPCGEADPVEASAEKTVTKTHLVPNSECLMLVLKGQQDEAVLSEENLLYIDQKQADENGTAEFTYTDYFGETENTVFIFGYCGHASTEWQTVLTPTEDEEGLETLICMYCGQELEERTVDKLPESTEYDPFDPTATEYTDPTETETEDITNTEPTEPTVTEPSETEATEPSVTEPSETAPTEPTVTEPSETALTEPSATEPSETTPTEPTVTEPSVTAPTEPTVTKPVETTPTEATEPVTVKKIDISGWQVRGLTDQTYTGKKITQSIKVTNGKRTATVKTSYKNNINVGKATITITGTGFFTGRIVRTFKIKKATQKMTVISIAKTVKYSAVKKKAQPLKKPIFVLKSIGKLTYTRVKKGSSKYLTVSKNGKISLKKKTPKGKYKLKLKITAKGDKNYKSCSKTVTVNVQVK